MPLGCWMDIPVLNIGVAQPAKTVFLAVLLFSEQLYSPPCLGVANYIAHMARLHSGGPLVLLRERPRGDALLLRARERHREPN